MDMLGAADEADASDLRWGVVRGKRVNYDGEGEWLLEICWGGPGAPSRLRREVPGRFGACKDDLACADPAVDCGAWHLLGEPPRVGSDDAIRTVCPCGERRVFDVEYDFEERMWILGLTGDDFTVRVNADTGEIVR